MPTDKQRRESARRHLERQLQRRQEREARRRKITLIASISMTVVLIAAVVVTVVLLNNDGKSSTAAAGSSTTPTTSAAPSVTPSVTPSVSASPSATTSTVAKSSYPCSWPAATTSIKVRDVKAPPTTKPAKTGKVTVSVATNRGAMTFALNRAGVPCTVESFVSLVQQKYFDKSPCHRLVTAGIYVLQCGDPSGKGTGGPGYSIPDEATGKETYPAGTIAMARSSAPNSGGSQFFVVYKDSPSLEQHLGKLQYTVFGKVTSGLSVVQKIAAGGANNANGAGDGAPKLATEIESMKLAK